MLLFQTFILLGLGSLSFATLVLKELVFPRADSDPCSVDPIIPYSADCWDKKNVGDYLRNWVKTTKHCGPGDDVGTCCGTGSDPNEAWSKCFLRLALANSDFTGCSKINLDLCDLGGFTLKGDYAKSVEARYIVRNIWIIHNFFSEWYVALQFATGLAALDVQNIVNAIDPPRTNNVALGNLLASLSAGLATLLGPLAPAVDSGVKAAANAFAQAIGQTPGLVKNFFPASAENDQNVQIGQLDKALKDINTNFGKTFTDTLSSLMTDSETFANFANHGTFSADAAISLPKETKELSIGLTTFIVTTAMDMNGYTAWYGPLFTDGLTNDAGSISSTFGCRYGANDICDCPKGQKCKFGIHEGWGMWSSHNTQRLFSPQKYFAKPAAGPASAELLNDIVTQGWGRLDLIFDGAYNCGKANGPGGNKNAVVKANPDGSLDYNCISQVKAGNGCATNGGDSPWGKVKDNKACTPFYAVY
ncbi:uncharacterized protein KY384_003930 [Bacidia gigantensis]|uniref:uncharacterized protein n=1 Tax=Bacidia gigantensis TaxID=2732470 RepID=UPI001D0360BA|nr:uncharacterized protein KY384_003930 [Bacidia gigantensis]KAG8532289.1 hypothetical protein KY384_003930 [Bacidia gigantensis]